jgi:cytosine/adenosine deaminase-related metal-dependent hydrolase
MSVSLIRSRAMVTHAIDRHRWNEITDGAVLQEDGAIVEIGTYRDLSRRHPNVAVIGSGNEVMLPGFVNGHHHIGLTPVQLGSPDMPLELWFVTRMVMRNVNLYLDTLYSAFEMIASGVTTVQHLHGRVPGKLDQVDRGSTRRSAPTRMSGYEFPTRTRCATRTGSFTSGTKTSLPACRPSCAVRCCDGSSAFN